MYFYHPFAKDRPVWFYIQNKKKQNKITGKTAKNNECINNNKKLNTNSEWEQKYKVQKGLK